MNLVVDLDDSLVRTDLFYELLITAVKQRPWVAFALPFWVLRGKAYTKARLAAEVLPDPAMLPYRESVLELIREARSRGGKVWLASASHEAWVRVVAEHLQVFDGFIGTDGTKNLSGAEKLQAIRAVLGGGAFEYVGDSPVDLAIWKGAAGAVAVNPSAALERRLSAEAPGISVKVLRDDLPSRARAWRKALRMHQWAKNSLLFLPIIAGHRYLETELWQAAAQAFLSFSLLASAVYVMNDLLDLGTDRKHPTKNKRPFASGALSVRAGILVIPVLAFFSLALAWSLPVEFSWILALYLGLNLLYTFRLKKLLMLDVVALSAMYALRILAGGEATGIEISTWLLSFSTFFFFGLAVVKRYVEVRRLKQEPSSSGRGYAPGDQSVLLALGVSGSMLSLLVLALYLNSETVLQLYSYPGRLWLVAPALLYWSSRVWVLAHRGEIDDDPVLFAIKDVETWVTGAVLLGILYYAL